MRKSPLNLPSPFSPFLQSCGNSRSRALSVALGLGSSREGHCGAGGDPSILPVVAEQQHEEPLEVPGGALVWPWRGSGGCSPFPHPAPLFVLVGRFTQIFTSKVNTVQILIICSRNERITVGVDQSVGCALLAERLLPARCPQRCSWSPPRPKLPIPSPEIWDMWGGKTKAQKPSGVSGEPCPSSASHGTAAPRGSGAGTGISWVLLHPQGFPSLRTSWVADGCEDSWGLWSCSGFGTTEDGAMPLGCGAVQGDIQPCPQNDLQSPGRVSPDCHVQQRGPFVLKVSSASLPYCHMKSLLALGLT